MSLRQYDWWLSDWEKPGSLRAIMSRVNRLHNHNTHGGRRGWMNEAACPGLLHRVGRGALGMSGIAWMTNKANPVKALIPSPRLSCCLAKDPTCLPRCQPDSLSAPVPVPFSVLPAFSSLCQKLIFQSDRYIFYSLFCSQKSSVDWSWTIFSLINSDWSEMCFHTVSKGDPKLNYVIY